MGRRRTARQATSPAATARARWCARLSGTGFPGDTYRQVFYVADVEAAGPPVGGELHRDLDEADFLAVFPLEPARGGLVLSESFTTTGPIGIPFCWTRCSTTPASSSPQRGVHRQAIERREPHCGRERNSLLQCASRAAIAEMRYDNAAIGDFGRPLRQDRGNVFVG